LRLADHAAVSAAPPGDGKATRPRAPVARIIERWSSLLDSKWPRGVGVAASAVIIVASLAYGVVRGDHVPSMIAGLKGARDGVAGATGFRVVSIALAGNHHVSRADLRYDDTPGGTGELVVLEVNTQPGMTETSLVPEIAAHAGFSFGELVRWMVEDASYDR